MKLVIIGASGGIGRELVQQATRAGHDVTAVVRDPRAAPSGVTPLVVDFASTRLDPRALEGVDAVLSALGPRSAAESGIATQATKSVLAAMKTAGAVRLLVVSAAPIGSVALPGQKAPPNDPGDDFLTRHLLSPIIKQVFRRQYADLATMEESLRRSDAAWTAVRPPRLLDRPHTGVYRTAIGKNVTGGREIGRADVADCMLRAVDQRETLRTSVGVAY